MNNNILTGFDTDSIMICKPDQSVWSDEERRAFLQALNAQFPSTITFADDGYYPKALVLKAKNYVLFDGKKIKYKGSALKSSTLETAYKDFIKDIVESIIYERNDYTAVYMKYVNEIMSITTAEQMKRYSSKKTLSDTTFESKRANETKIVEAIKDSEYRKYDRVWLFYKNDDTLCLAERFDGDYNKERLLKKLFNASRRFAKVIDVSGMINYSLKKNYKILCESE